jgi:hypothetical protein
VAILLDEVVAYARAVERLHEQRFAFDTWQGSCLPLSGRPPVQESHIFATIARLALLPDAD